ncbi:MAG: bifunctional phosphopantothenoylcysteine decarboxylase/phosphopantothenate--cysteine ligase CoaBC [Pyrinomonadaceae bacterium]
MKTDELSKHVGLCVTGGIAAYKAIEVLRLLQKAGCEVDVAMTKHATKFVQPLTFRALTGRRVIVDDYDAKNPDAIAHINFSQTIDLLLIVPATANIIAKFANGIADDFVSTTFLASNAPVLIAPAMNETMWMHPATQKNLNKLRTYGINFVEPISGELACKTVGIGKLEDAENIAAQALMLISPVKPKQDLSETHILITVGGTREAIDPVRFISNHSSGKMGFALAQAAARRGAKVTVVKGSTTAEIASGVEIIDAISAKEMYECVFENLENTDIFIGAAAVADFRPAVTSLNKIKKEGNNSLSLKLERTEDILSSVSKNRHKGLLVIGFAAETDSVIENARKKLFAKEIDMIVANDVSEKGLGFGSDSNAALLLLKTGQEIDIPRMTKYEMANRILDEIVTLRNNEN